MEAGYRVSLLFVYIKKHKQLGYCLQLYIKSMIIGITLILLGQDQLSRILKSDLDIKPLKLIMFWCSFPLEQINKILTGMIEDHAVG